MSVDRSYLSSKLARQYQDRKMAKWMGFFLSEHSSALNQSSPSAPFAPLSPQDKLLLLNQAYTQQLLILITCLDSHTGNTHTHTGVLKEWSLQTCHLQDHHNYHIILFDTILNIQWVEEESL